MSSDDALQHAHARHPKSHFLDLDLSGSVFDDVSLREAVFVNVALSGARFSNVNLGGASIDHANLVGARIDGVLVTDLQAAWAAQVSRNAPPANT